MSSVSLYDQLFSRYCTFRIFSFTPMLKYKVPQIFYFLQDRQDIYNFTFPYNCLIYHKVWLRSDQKCRRSSVLKFPLLCTVLAKISKCHKILNFWQIAKTFVTFSPMCILFIKVWPRSDENCVRNSVLKFLLP